MKYFIQLRNKKGMLYSKVLQIPKHHFKYKKTNKQTKNYTGFTTQIEGTELVETPFYFKTTSPPPLKYSE